MSNEKQKNLDVFATKSFLDLLGIWKFIADGFQKIDFIFQTENGEYFVAGIPKENDTWLLEVLISNPDSNSDGKLPVLRLTSDKNLIGSILEQLNEGVEYTTTDQSRNIWIEDSSVQMRWKQSGHIRHISLGTVESKILLQWYSHYSRTGRNDHCPCNSGKKFKRCCDIERNYPITKVKYLPRELRWLEEINELREFMFAATMKPSVLEDSDYWHALGYFSRTLGIPHHVTACFTRCLEIDPTNHDRRIDLITCLRAEGKLDEAIDLLNQIPLDTKHRSLNLGLALFNKNNDIDAIPHLENAILENPEEEIAYHHLLWILEGHRHPSWEYWINKSVRHFPSSPSVAFYYARCMLMRQKFVELSESDWIDEINEIPDPNLLMINIETPEEAISTTRKMELLAARARILRDMAICYLDSDSKLLEQLVQDILRIDPSERMCFESYRVANDLCTNRGIPEFIKDLYARGHQQCIEQGDRGHERYYPYAWYGHITEQSGEPSPPITLQAIAYGVIANDSYARGDWEQAAKVAEKAIRENPEIKDCRTGNDRSLLSYYATALQCTDRKEEGLHVGQQLYDQNPDGPSIYQIMAELNQNCGNLGAARYYYQQQINIKPNSDCHLRIGIIELLQHNYAEFDHHVSKFFELTYGSLHTLIDRSLAQELGGIRKFLADLRFYAKNNTASSTLAKDIFERFNKYFGWDTFRFSISTNMHSLADLTADETDASIMDQLKFESRLEKFRDFSAPHASLIKQLPTFDSLPSQAQLALYEAEKLFLTDHPGVDYSHVVFLFAKALEICLSSIVFKTYSVRCNESVILIQQIKECLDECSQNRKSQIKNLCSYLGKGQFLELGKMTHILKLCNGRTAQKNVLVGNLHRFIVDDLKSADILDKDNLADLDRIAIIRGPKVHEEIATEAEADECRTLCMNILLKLKPIPLSSQV